MLPETHSLQEHAISRYLIIADVHANLEALNAVIAAAAPFEQLWCLGDLVGYGPNPNECIELIRRYDHVAVAGNHDWVACGKRTAAGFNPNAAYAAQWTATQLNAEARRFLFDLPETVTKEDFLLVHGSPRAPTQEYLFRAAEAEKCGKHFSTTYCFVGHTHVPCAFIEAGRDSPSDVYGVALRSGEPLPLDGRMRMIVNPGSVGQPRDYNPQAAYGIYDTGSREFQLHRVAYDVAATQENMRAADLPESLIKRLAFGV
ncbi:MAG: metallophosphoesterase family protein [Chloroflexota bacterium]|nr:metallophosphoesterase family protein [Chloroflexota bacterium]